MTGLLAFFGSIIGLGADWLKRKQETAAAQAERKDRVAEAETNARIRRLENAQDAEIEWDTEAVKQMSSSWKDEWFTVLLSIPLVLAFLPWDWAKEAVSRGFDNLEKMPEWYAISLGLAIAASFGYRKLVDAVQAWRRK